MMKNILKWLVFGLVYWSGARTLYQWLTPGRLRTLCYHRISYGSDDPLLDVSVERFRAQMQYLARCFTPYPLEAAVSDLAAGRIQRLRHPFALTLDDGTEDWLRLALPVLEEYHLPATFFVCTGYIGNGTIAYADHCTPAEALSLSDLQQLAASPLVTLGGHTYTHPHLSRLSAEDAFREISQSKKMLEQWTHRQVRLFAYPFGEPDDYTEETKRLTARAGFTAAFTLDERTAGKREDPYALPRMVIFDEPLWMFKVRVSGIIDDALMLAHSWKTHVSH